MLGFLKPTKWKIIGTVLILVADWIAGFISGQLGQFIIPKEMAAAIAPAFTEALQGAGLIQLMIAGLIIMAAGFILKVVFYYAALSFILDKQAK